MTNIVFDLVDVVGEVEPGDTVRIWPPRVTRNTEGQAVVTRPENIDVGGGPVTRDVSPGPLWVQIQAGGYADTDPKLVRVPTPGEIPDPITIADLLRRVEHYDRVLESWAWENAHVAEQAALDAIAARGQAEVQAGVSKDAADVAVAAAQGMETFVTSAAASADRADNRAASAEAKVDAYTPRVAALEAMNGVAPQSPVDGQTANLIGQSETLTRGAVIDAVGAVTGIVSVKDFGAVGDGIADDTLSIQSAIDHLAALGGGTVYVPPGIYMVKGHEPGAWFDHLDENTGVRLRDNINFVMDSGATLQAITNGSSFYNILRLWDVHNVSISGGTLRGDRYDHTGTSGEWGYGILIVAGSNIHVENVTSVDMWGDGINLQRMKDPDSDALIPPKNITIKHVRCSNNRRQGMSVESVSGLYVSDSVFEKTSGTAPMCGVDIEPMDSVAEASGITFERCRFMDNGGSGLLVIKRQVTGVTVKDCYFSGNLSQNGQLQTVNDLTNLRVMGCEFVADGAPANAIYLRGGSNIVLLRNISDQTFQTVSGTGDGARVRDLVIEGNEIRTVSEPTVNLSLSTRVTIRGNLLSSESAQENVKVWDTGQITVSENRIVGGFDGLWLSGTLPWRSFKPSNYLIRGNIFEDQGRTAIRLALELEGCTISENTFRGAGHIAHYNRAINILSLVTGTKIIGNSFYQKPVEVEQVGLSRGAVRWAADSTATDTIISGNTVVPEGEGFYEIWDPADAAVSTGYIGGADGMMRAPTSKRPTAPATGLIMYDTTLGKLITWNGTAWANLDGTSLTPPAPEEVNHG